MLYNPVAVFYTMPLGLMAIASNLDTAKYDVRIIDGRIEADPVGRVLRELDGALCLGITVLTGAPIGDALRVLRAAKQKYPQLATICGGWHPSLFSEQMLEEATIDVTVRGQGEATFAELVARLDADESLAGVRGVAFREHGSVVTNDERPLLPMDLFAPVDYSLVPVERYYERKGQRQLDYISSTGCLFRCAFCADPFVYGRGWQALPPERVDAEIDALWQRYRFSDLNFQDETFFTYRKRVAELAELFLRRGRRFSWAATMRADQGVRLGEDVFALCVRSGMRRVLIGVESGSPDMLTRIQKDTTVEQIVAAAELCRSHGIAVIFSFIVGFPGETDEQLMQTVALVQRLRRMSPRFETPIFYYKPYPGSTLSVGLESHMPATLDGWAGFDYVQGQPGPWVSPETHQFMERFKFYNRYAGGAERLVKMPLQKLARWRCRNNRFALPIEKLIIERLRPETRLS